MDGSKNWFEYPSNPILAADPMGLDVLLSNADRAAGISSDKAPGFDGVIEFGKNAWSKITSGVNGFVSTGGTIAAIVGYSGSGGR